MIAGSSISEEFQKTNDERAIVQSFPRRNFRRFRDFFRFRFATISDFLLSALRADSLTPDTAVCRFPISLTVAVWISPVHAPTRPGIQEVETQSIPLVRGKGFTALQHEFHKLCRQQSSARD
jgi:hypothetical protein